MDDLAQRSNGIAKETQATQPPLQAISTPALMRQAISEIKLLAKAEMLHARLELQDELREARRAGVMLGCSVALLLCGLSVALVGIALTLPLAEWAAAFLVAALLLALGAVCGVVGYRCVPRKPLQKTQQRIKEDLAITREQLA